MPTMSPPTPPPTLSTQPAVPARFGVPRRVTGNARFAVTIAAVLGVLVAVNVLLKFGPPRTGLVLGPAVALVLVILARRYGLTWDHLGMSRRALRKGIRYAAIAVVVVGCVYLLGALLPVTRAAFLDMRYHLQPGAALLAALVVVPFGTVLLEEVAFRGVLLGLVHRHRGPGSAKLLSSGLFGLWHILPSLRLSRANQAAGLIFGAGTAGQFLAVAGAVGFTALAGLLLCELRRRSGSLLAAAGLHWATNALGLVLATAVWAVRTA
jgi:membrane protease YdiL (CAAX protease family)